jgi:hypothetical protein
MKIEFAFFRSGKERSESALEFEMPAVPRPGDQIVIRKSDSPEVPSIETFRVRRTVWYLTSPVSKDALKVHGQQNKVGFTDIVTVECESEREGAT